MTPVSPRDDRDIESLSCTAPSHVPPVSKCRIPSEQRPLRRQVGLAAEGNVPLGTVLVVTELLCDAPQNHGLSWACTPTCRLAQSRMGVGSASAAPSCDIQARAPSRPRSPALTPLRVSLLPALSLPNRPGPVPSFGICHAPGLAGRPSSEAVALGFSHLSVLAHSRHSANVPLPPVLISTGN